MAASFLPDDLRAALAALRSGGVILYPTDTVWGIGCDATNAEAVARIYRIKRRAESKSMILLVDSVARVENYVMDMPGVAYDLIDVADRPTTIIYDRAKNLPDNLTAEDGSVAIRVTNEEFSNALCFRAHVPLVSTSANLSGRPTPHCFSEIEPEIIEAVDYVVRFRRDDNRRAEPSSIIKLGAGGQVRVIR